MYVLQKVEKIPLAEKRNYPLSKFKLGRFLNELPSFSKDKRGANIDILIIQILIFLLEKNMIKS